MIPVPYGYKTIEGCSTFDGVTFMQGKCYILENSALECLLSP